MKKYIFVGMVVLTAFFLVSCDRNNPVNPSGETTESSALQSSSSAPTTGNTSTAELISSSTVSTEGSAPSFSLTRAEIKNWFETETTFNELKDEFNLKIEDESEYGSLYTISNNMTDVSFNFIKKSNNSEIYSLSYIKAPASILLPEYVDMPIDQIPIVSQPRLKDVDCTRPIRPYY